MLAPAAEQGPVPWSARCVAGAVSIPGQLDAGLHLDPVAAGVDAHSLYGRRRERFGRRARSVHSLRGAGAFLVEAQTVARPAAEHLVAGIAVGGLRARAAFVRVPGPANPHLHYRALRRHLRLDGPGVGTPMAARELLPVHPVCLLRAAGLVRRDHHLSFADAGVPRGGVYLP